MNSEMKPKHSGIIFSVIIGINIILSFAVGILIAVIAMRELGAGASPDNCRNMLL